MILQEIMKRNRVDIPTILLTGKRFGNGSKYSIYDAWGTVSETNKFVFKSMSGTINFNDYKKELVYLKIFNKTINEPQTRWKDLTRGTMIIKINDMENKVFYMYIKLGLKGYCQSCDGNNEINYRIVYSSSFDDLVYFIYKPYQIPDFLNSDAFVSIDDKTKEQKEIIQEYNKLFITPLHI